MNEVFEAELEDVYRYRLSYGGQSPFFFGLQEGKLMASCCSGCGHVWLPFRPVCSRCYSEAAPKELSGKAEILTVIKLPMVPEHLQHLNRTVASALVLPDGANTCLKAYFVGEETQLVKGARVEAHYLPDPTTIADFYFAPEAD